jgi:hypothetical protein
MVEGTACYGCKYLVQISDAVWKKMFHDGKLPTTANIEQKMNFCAMAARFLRSAIMVCSIKEGKAGQLDLSFANKTETEWDPTSIISS